MRRRAVFAAFVFAASVSVARAIDAQQPAGNGTISGRVTDAQSGAPLDAVTIAIQGTELAAITGPDGTYRITRVPNGTHRLAARRLGYGAGTRAVTTGDGQTVTADFALQTSAVNLQEVVVTGTAGNQTRAAQGAVVSTINATDVTAKAPVSTVTQVLEGRVAGVNVTTSSGTTGSAPRIAIRGATSISLSNAPLVFIDGVRTFSGQRNDVGSYHNLEGLGGQAVTALNDINPDDIESIEVVKGPAAATLYGADASAGVIQIITKKGRLGSRSFRQNAALEWNQVQPNFTPLPIYGKCSAAATTSPTSLCSGLTAGAVVSDNPLVRSDVFRNGHLGSLAYNAQGGGDNFGYYVSADASDEQGTTTNNYYQRRTGRASFNWVATPALGIDATIGMSRNDYRLPDGDDANYGFLTQQYALSSISSVTVAPDGTRSGGLSTPVAGLEAVQNELTTVRFTPSAQVHYSPFPWLTNRLTLGADIGSTHGITFYPKNSQNWYAGDQANGYVEDVQNPVHLYTVDYLGNIHTMLSSARQITSDFSFGSQYINTVNNYLAGIGIGLATNSSNLVSSAATNEAHQVYSQSKSLGLLAQEQLSFGQMLFVQGGARVDRNSAFGSAFGSLVLPKVSASYVVSQEPFWRDHFAGISTLRLRAAYGTTGRSPDPGASLKTYAPFSYVTPSGGVGPGVIQASPGNANLKPERGTEFEGGFDAGFFHERAGIELTYFDKHTSDLLLRNPLAPSLAYTTNPYINAGSVDNRGLEFTLHGSPVESRNFRWDAALTGSTLKNKLISLGPVSIPAQSEISPDLTLRYVLGKPLLSWYSSKIIAIDTTAGFATVTGSPVFAGPQFPTLTANFSNTVTLFRNFKVYGLLTHQQGGRILNVTPLYRDLVGISAGVNQAAGQGGYSKKEMIEHEGPFKTASGTPVGLVLDRYLQPTDFVRLAELSATYDLPTTLAQRLHAAGASLVVGGRNLHLWKKKSFEGDDPEVLSNTTLTGQTQFATLEEFTVPQARRWLVRLNLQF
jgi:TonB-linked SusC/RagA family outer membrane protein